MVHYSIPERVENETATILATDPLVWNQLSVILDDD